jgi:hypothetical protein
VNEARPQTNEAWSEARASSRRCKVREENLSVLILISENKGLAFLGELCAFARKLILFLALRFNFFVYFVAFVEKWFESRLVRFRWMSGFASLYPTYD